MAIKQSPPLKGGVALAVGIDFSHLRVTDAGVRFIEPDAVTPDFKLEADVTAVIAWHNIGVDIIERLKSLAGKRTAFRVAYGFNQAKTLLEPYWSWNRRPRQEKQIEPPAPTDEPPIRALPAPVETKVKTVDELVAVYADLKAPITAESLRLMSLAGHFKLKVAKESEIRLAIRRWRKKRHVKPLPPPPMEFLTPGRKKRRRKKRPKKPDNPGTDQPTVQKTEPNGSDQLAAVLITVDEALKSMAVDLETHNINGNGELRLFADVVVQINYLMAPLRYQGRLPRLNPAKREELAGMGANWGVGFLTNQITDIRGFLDQLKKEITADETRLPKIHSAVKDTAEVLGL